MVTSVLSLAVQNEKLRIFKTLRLVRALRPLRMISRLKGMQLVVQALLKSLPQVFHVTLFGLFEFGVFGILGLQLFSG